MKRIESGFLQWAAAICSVISTPLSLHADCSVPQAPIAPAVAGIETAMSAVNGPHDVFKRSRQCELFSRVDRNELFGGGLSPLWAQELIGADLAKEIVNADPSSKTVNFASFESIDLTQMDPKTLSPGLLKCRSNMDLPACKGLRVATTGAEWDDGHGNLVASLVADPTVGVGAKAKLVMSASTDTLSPFLKTRFELNANRIMTTHAQLLCNSMVTNAHDLTQAYRSLSRHGLVIVESSGDSARLAASKYPSDIPVIQVGSLSPTGLISGFSTPGATVTIAAPGDFNAQSKINEKFESFSGTSASQPMVCGAISNVMSLLPGITAREIAQMIDKTAIPTANIHEEPRTDGAGTINALKLAEVASNLQKGWPMNRRDIFNSPAIYDLSQKSQSDLSLGKALLGSSNACDRAAGAKLIRASFLLDPGAEDSMNALASLYESQGYIWNANFIRSIGGVSQAYIHDLFETNDSEIWDAAIRYDDHLWPDDREQVTELAQGRFINTHPEYSGYQAEDAAYAAITLASHGETALAISSLSRAIQSANSTNTVENLFVTGAPAPGLDFAPALIKACLFSKANFPEDCVRVAVWSHTPADVRKAALRWLDANFSRAGDFDSFVADLKAEGQDGIHLLQRHLEDPSLTATQRASIAKALGTT